MNDNISTDKYICPGCHVRFSEAYRNSEEKYSRCPHCKLYLNDLFSIDWSPNYVVWILLLLLFMGNDLPWRPWSNIAIAFFVIGHTLIRWIRSRFMRPPEKLRYTIKRENFFMKKPYSLLELIKTYFYVVMIVFAFILLRLFLIYFANILDYQEPRIISIRGYLFEGFFFFSIWSPVPLILYLESLEKRKFENGELILVGVIVSSISLFLTFYLFNIFG